MKKEEGSKRQTQRERERERERERDLNLNERILNIKYFTLGKNYRNENDLYIDVCFNCRLKPFQTTSSSLLITK